MDGLWDFLISILGGGKLLEDEIDIQRREKTYSDRLQQIEHVKKVRAVGYRLYKSDPNRPPTPDPSGEIVISLITYGIWNLKYNRGYLEHFFQCVQF